MAVFEIILMLSRFVHSAKIQKIRYSRIVFDNFVLCTMGLYAFIL